MNPSYDLQRRRRPVLGVNAFGLGILPGSWQEPGVSPTSVVDLAYWETVAELVARARLDVLFLADSPLVIETTFTAGPRLDPAVLLASLVPGTTGLGFVSTESTTYADASALAQRYGTLDHLSSGRFGWNIVTTFSEPVAANFGHPGLPDHDDRIARAEHIVSEIRQRWSDAPHSPTPALFAAGGSPATMGLAGRHADALFTAASTRDVAAAGRSSLRSAALAAGRNPDDLAYTPGLEVTLGSTEQEAHTRLHRLYDRAPDDYLLHFVSGGIGIDLTALNPDEPIPTEFLDTIDLNTTAAGTVGFRRSWLGSARSFGGTLREFLYQSREHGGLHGVFVGVPEQLADRIEDWFRSGAVDGFILMPDAMPSSLQVIANELAPLLRRRGLLREEYIPGATLRDNLLEGTRI